MSDTQWPRYYVFKQDKPADSHQSCGTVHAVDPEMALQIARDVFVRRPDCHSLWVVPEEAVLTRPELAEAAGSSGDGEGRTFLIFARPNQRDPHLYQREIKAASAAEALKTFEKDQPALAKLGAWSVPRTAISVSQAGQEEAWFRPAEAKRYRHSSFYHPDRLLRKIRTEDD